MGKLEVKHKKQSNQKWLLVVYDVIVYIAVIVFLLLSDWEFRTLPLKDLMSQVIISFFCIFTARFLGNIYKQVWRYGGIQCYIRLLLVDAAGFAAYFCMAELLPIQRISFASMFTLVGLNLLCALAMRMIYRYAYKYGSQDTRKGKFLSALLHIFSGIEAENKKDVQKIKVAIIGAGRVGVSLAEELLNNKEGAYLPRCFIDINKGKVGRVIYGIPVFSEDEVTFEKLEELEVQEIIFAIPSMDVEKKNALYEYYKKAGYKLKVYASPTIYAAGGKRQLREFDVEELLFRKPIVISDKRTRQYYEGKIILITGGGGSIGSELCRQIAKMHPKRIVILDIYENGAYDVQQELKIEYGTNLDVQIEICSITNKAALERVFEKYHPEIIVHAAAHKHVPLMEDNCIEAIYNNVFGTQNLVELCEAYKAERFLMVSTDKAVNPTNVMGATKRMCEMLVQSASTHGKVKYSATRFGNVLGSAGSVIPLFKRQIASGGPVTVTDKRIIRYFMTIPEASQLVLQSGAIANNGELFVLDMGQPVKIIDLAENMIRLSGVQGVEIVETGLRPGEKLYEELLVKTEELDKTENSMIFIERDTALTQQEIQQKLTILEDACNTGSNAVAREALRSVVPTYKRPEEVNGKQIAEQKGKNMESKIWLSSPTMHGEELKYMTEAYATNWMSTIGENIDEVERLACEQVGCKYAVGLNSGTSAIHLAIRLAGIHPGEKVFCTDMTFDATVNPVSYEGGEQVFIDSEYETWNMDPKALEKAFALYPDVKVVIVANLYGTPAKLDEIRSICDAHNAILIEDAAESLGATYKGQQTGTFGAYNAISFNGNKIITGSAGGMLLTDNLDAANKVRKWSTQSRENAPWYQHEEIGYNYRMSNVVAGVVRGQFPYLQEHIAQKKAIYTRYKEGLKDLPVTMNPYLEDIMEPNFWLSCLLIDKEAMCEQTRSDKYAQFHKNKGEGKSCPTEIFQELQDHNIQCRPIWKPMHLQPMYQMKPFVTVDETIDVGADIFDRGLCLPSDNKMTPEEQDRVIEIIKGCFR